MRIAAVQGLRNPLIAEPSSIHYLLDASSSSYCSSSSPLQLLRGSGAPLEMFKEFDYDAHYCEDGLFDHDRINPEPPINLRPQ